MVTKIKNYLLPQLFIIYTRYLIGGAFVFASVIKIKGHRFTSVSGEDAAINTAWHFFETMYQSGLYWNFIGVGQLISGLLLMTQRYAKLGALLNFPIILNIFVVTISYNFAGTPLITGFMLLANISLILWDYNTFRVLWNQKPIAEDTSRIEFHPLWSYLGIILFLFTFSYRWMYNQYNLFVWFGFCFVAGIIGAVIGLRVFYKRKRIKNEALASNVL